MQIRRRRKSKRKDDSRALDELDAEAGSWKMQERSMNRSGGDARHPWLLRLS